MRVSLRFVVPVLALTACQSTAPLSFSAPTPETLDSTFACALRQVNVLGYTVTNVEKAAGFVTAEKQSSTKLTAFMGVTSHDQLTVVVFDDVGGQRRIRVTAAGKEEKTNGKGSKSGVGPSDTAKADAGTLLKECAPGGSIQTSLLPTGHRSEALLP